jgi:hypothetical protein
MSVAATSVTCSHKNPAVVVEGARFTASLRGGTGDDIDGDGGAPRRAPGPERDRVRKALLTATVEAFGWRALFCVRWRAFINCFIARTLCNRDRPLIDLNETAQKYMLGDRDGAHHPARWT